jgi:hypothetical protein
LDQAGVIILATQEAEIRRNTVRSQFGQISSGDPIWKISNIKKKRADGVAQGVGREFKPQYRKKKKKKVGGVAQVVGTELKSEKERKKEILGMFKRGPGHRAPARSGGDDSL